MAKSIKISIDTSKYRTPTEEDVQAAKDYILQREEMAGVLGTRIDDALARAAVLILLICYKYNIDPKRLFFSSAFNQDMMDEISAVMGEIETAIYYLIREYATRGLHGQARLNELLKWMDALGKGGNNLLSTLHGYLFKTMKDWEAAIAALMYMGVEQSMAVTRIQTYLHSIYTMPEVLTAFRRRLEFAATYIYYGGVQSGAVGISNNGSTNVVNMAKTTLQMAWMREEAMEYEDNGAVGIYVLRGSNYPCGLCDDACGFHPIEMAMDILPQHPHCCCYAIPIYKNDIT